jgi:hypothetical protein
MVGDGVTVRSSRFTVRRSLFVTDKRRAPEMHNGLYLDDEQL